jgi:hypothetical protein
MEKRFGGRMFAAAIGFVLVFCVSGNASAAEYCVSNGGSHQFEYILDTLYTQIPTDTMSATIQIYIANPTNCVSGEPCPAYDDSPEYINAWIDWNGNGIFEESERVLDVALTGYLGINYYGTMSTSTIVTIPSDAVATTWMRVNLGWDHDPNDPCEVSWTWGDVIDRQISTRTPVPRISQINVTGIPDAKNPMTSDTSVAGAEKVRLDAVIAPADGYEVLTVSWSGEVQPGDGNPYEYTADPGSHGMKYVVCTITYRNTTTGETATDTRSRNFKLFFPKNGDDNGDGEPNWFEYWKRDEAVPNMNPFLYNPTATYYGCYCGGQLYLGPSGAGQHYSSAIVLNTYFGTESFGGPAVKGVDSASEIIGHELYHKWVGEQWADGWSGESDSDKGAGGCQVCDSSGSCRDCRDYLPDDYETNTSHTSNSDTDTYDLEHKKHPDYKDYGDQEYMAMRTGNGARGIVIRDWANPGKQSDPPYGCHSLKDYAPVYAQFTGYYSDLGIDLDADSLFEYLRILAEVDVTAWGPFHILARLQDQASNEITFINKEFILYPGTHLVALDFDGLAIREHGANGPYRVSLFMDDEEGIEVDHRSEAYTTSVYSYANFKPRDARFAAYRDRGTDSDGDTLYDALVIEVDIDVNTPGDYLIEGGLYDSSPKAIQMGSRTVPLLAGRQTVELSFSGLAINRNRVDGPFYLKYLSLSRGGRVDFVKDAYMTNYYGFASFERADARLSGVYSDHGEDSDSNGLYDYLRVDVELDILLAGKYTLTGWLYDSDGTQIVMTTNSVALGAGLQTMPLDFDGSSIYLNGTNGPFSLKYLTVHHSNGMLMDTIKNAYTTGAYNYTDFQPPLVGLTRSYSDYGTDTNMDGKFDFLTVQIGVLLTNPGYCVAKGRLIDAQGKEITWAEKIINLGAGVSTIPLDFKGTTIYNNAVDGPYYLRDVYVYHVGDPFQPAYVHEAYATTAYDYCQFGDCSPVADAGPDQIVLASGDCIATVALDGSKSHDPEGNALTSYSWTWSLNGSTHSASGISPTIQLPLGDQTIALVVSDGTMNSKPDTVKITVLDNTPPLISLSAYPKELWPPNHKMVSVTVNPNVFDNCDPNPICKIISVSSNEPQNGLGDGDMAPDWKITGDLTLSLRAERSGKGKGRVYTTTVMCTDLSLNTSKGTVIVTVPSDARK